MVQTKTFIEVLEDEIRADLRRELEAELANRPSPDQIKATHAAGRFETWMASNIGPVTFKTNRGYKTTSQSGAQAGVKSRATEPVRIATSEPRFHAATSAEIFALELLVRHSGLSLPHTFSAAELKTVWRKAALKSHPDRYSQADVIEQTRATALFRELALAYETLSALTDLQIAA